MNVVGLSSHTSLLELSLPTTPKNLLSSANLLFVDAATWSIHQKPALWRVASYLSPGLPRPTNNLMLSIFIVVIRLSVNKKRALHNKSARLFFTQTKTFFN